MPTEEGGAVDHGYPEVLAHDEVADGEDDRAVLPHHSVGSLHCKQKSNSERLNPRTILWG